MTSDTPKRSTQPVHAFSDRSRQSLAFSTAATSERSRTRTTAASKLTWCLVLLLLLATAGFTILFKGQRSAQFSILSPSSNDKLRQFGLSASNELQNCTATSKSTVCKWARQHSRANRRRPADWEPKEGWPEDIVIMRSEHHASDRALTALDNASSSSTAAQESLQSVVNSLWPLPSETDLPTLDPSTLPQCAALYSQLCIAFVGNANVSFALQPEMQSCSLVRELDVVTSVTCEHSADVWILSQASGDPLQALTDDHQQCSRQQMLANTKTFWYLGGEQQTIAQLQHQDTGIASIPAVLFSDADWQQRYRRRATASSSATGMRPSPLWIGLLTVLECARKDAQIHVYPTQPSVQASSLHDTVAESDLLAKLHASGLIVLHEDCQAGMRCAAEAGGVTQQSTEGQLTAPGVRLYVHRKKWQDSSMRVYTEDEDEEDNDSA